METTRLPNLQWFKSTDNAEDSKKILIAACHHFLEACRSVEVADIRFHLDRSDSRGLISGIFHRSSDEFNIHKAVHDMGYRYKLLLHSTKNEREKMNLARSVDSLAKIKAFLLNVETIDVKANDEIIVIKKSLNEIKQINYKRALGENCDCNINEFCLLPSLTEIMEGIDIPPEEEAVDLEDFQVDQELIENGLINPLKAFLFASNNVGSLIYIPVRGIWLEKWGQSKLAGGLYLYNLSGKNIKINKEQLDYLIPMISMIGGHQDIVLHTDESFFSEIKRKSATSNPRWFSSKPVHLDVKHSLGDIDTAKRGDTAKFFTDNGLVLPTDFITNENFYEGLKRLLLTNDQRQLSSIYALFLLAAKQMRCRIDNLIKCNCPEEETFLQISEDGLQLLYVFFTKIVKNEKTKADIIAECDFNDNGFTIKLKDPLMRTVLENVMEILHTETTEGRHGTSLLLANFIKDKWRLFVNEPSDQSDQYCLYGKNFSNGDLSIWVQGEISFLNFSSARNRVV